MRDTLRLAVLTTRTSCDGGGGTMLAAQPNNTKATLVQLHQHLDKVLDAIEEELFDVGQHQVNHDLRAAGHPPLQILLATEWYFRIPDRPFTQAQRDGIITQLEALSAKYPDWLIVPGSIFWTPDNLAANPPIIRVYNQAPVLYGGAVIAVRTKREQHDIDSSFQVRAKQRWGPDYPTVDGAYAVPAPIAATQNLCSFTLRNRTICVEICRDHQVGDAVNAYLTAGQPGADIYLFLSNGVTLDKDFLPVVDNGIAVWCDGAGAGSHEYKQVTRANPLTNNWAAPNLHPFTAYRNSFEPERDHDVLSGNGLYESKRIESENDATFQSFMTKFNNVFGPGNSDPVLKAAIDASLGPLSAVNVIKPFHEKGRRIQQVLAGNQLPTGAAVPVAEANAMNPYATALVQFATEDGLVRAAKPTTAARRTTAINGFNVTTADLTPGTVNIAGFYDLTLYELQDL